MDKNALVIEEIDAGAELIRRFQEYMSVEAAIWLNPSEEGAWALYIASPQMDVAKYDRGFAEILKIVREMQTPYIDPFQVRLIGTDDPLAKAAVETNRKFPGPIPTRFRGKNFGGVPVEEVYIYAAKHPAPVD
jgi:hypothetical protein